MRILEVLKSGCFGGFLIYIIIEKVDYHHQLFIMRMRSAGEYGDDSEQKCIRTMEIPRKKKSRSS